MNYLFGSLFVPDSLRETVGGKSWLRAMCGAEAALARASAKVGVVPADAADVISSVCGSGEFLASLDPENVGRRGRGAGNPVPAFVKDLTSAVAERDAEAARYVHYGATSQDIMDTAMMLVCRDALDIILSDLETLTSACRNLTTNYRDTPMVGRTLMQQALPTTFGLKAAGWLVMFSECVGDLRSLRDTGLYAQLGGAAGTLASLGGDGSSVAREFARELGLSEPLLPWHTNRRPVGRVAADLSLLAGGCLKVASDIILMSQTEVGEVSEPAGEGRGGSSTLPHKRNPVLSVTASACARRAQSSAQLVMSVMNHEHERAAGAWHVEWEALSDSLAYTGGAVSSLAEALGGLEVHTETMRRNLDLTDGLLMAENVTTRAAKKLGRLRAHELVQQACRRVVENGTSLAEEVSSDSELGDIFTREEIEGALDPSFYIGSADVFVDRVLEKYPVDGKTKGGRA